eukprot:6807839-Prymnesium_polylepis.1
MELPPNADDQRRQLHMAATRHGDAGRPGLCAEDAVLRLRRLSVPWGGRTRQRLMDHEVYGKHGSERVRPHGGLG